MKKILFVVITSLLALTIVGCSSTPVVSPTPLPSETVSPLPSPTSTATGKNLVLISNNAPKNAKVISDKKNNDGTYEQVLLYDNTVSLTYSKIIKTGKNNGLTYAKEKFTDGRNYEADDKNFKAYSGQEVTFKTGKNEDTRENTIAYIETNEYVFIFHASYPLDADEKYDDLVEDWVDGLEIKEV